VEAERRTSTAEAAAAAEAAEATQLRERVRVLLSDTSAVHQQLQTEAREHRAAADVWAAELLRVKKEAAEAAATALQESAERQRATTAALHSRTEEAETVRWPSVTRVSVTDALVSRLHLWSSEPARMDHARRVRRHSAGRMRRRHTGRLHPQCGARVRVGA